MSFSNARPQSTNDVQSEINLVIDKLSSWKATLPFGGIVGGAPNLDLFEYTKPQYRAKRGSHNHSIKFDPEVYAPTDEGLLQLKTHLAYLALQEGTVLSSRNQKTILSCFRCRTYSSKGKASEEAKDEVVDVWGVKLGIREYKFHRDSSFKRAAGLSGVRGSSTSLPVDSTDVCPVKISFQIHKYGQPDGFIFMVCGHGSCFHSGHCKPNEGDLPVFKRLISKETQKLIQDGREASNGSSALRYLLLKNKNVFVTKTTLRSIQLPNFLVASAPGQTGTSTASRMVNWLRKQSQEEKIGIRYTVLFHKMLGGDNFHKFPKGRPSNDRVPLEQVNCNMHVQLSQVSDCPGLSERPEDCTEEEPIEPTDYLESVVFDGNSLSETYVKSSLPPDGMYGKDVLSEEALQHRKILDEFGLGSTRILLGAAWVDEYSWREFLRYPECLFVDTTHGTNNESRPLLQMVGRDSNGKAYTVLRIFMPNETASFYRWVFLEALPLLLGESNLSKINLILSDGDSQEFNAIDEGIFKFFKNAKRGRCAYHIVQKTWEKAFPSNQCFAIPDKADPFTVAIKRWIYNWMDGSNCGSEKQYEFSKDLLLHVLETNKEFETVLGEEGCQQIRHWINTKVLTLQDFTVFYPKKFVRCFDDYMNNVVEGMNFGAKKSDMAAKPKDNMDTAANAMQNQSNLKSRTKRSVLSRNINAAPLYIEPGYGHNISCLSRLQKHACHMIIQQFRGKCPCISFLPLVSRCTTHIRPIQKNNTIAIFR
jgi:hypothetical protein